MWFPSSSTAKRMCLLQAEMFLRIPPTDISCHDKLLSCPSMPARLIYLSSLVKLSPLESSMFLNPFGYILYFVEAIHSS